MLLTPQATPPIVNGRNGWKADIRDGQDFRFPTRQDLCSKLAMYRHSLRNRECSQNRIVSVNIRALAPRPPGQ
jgi:hypothetical protein